MGTQKLRNGVHRRVGDVTFEEFCDAVREDQKADLIDGVISMASPENTEANDLFCWLLALMEFFALETGAGRVFGSRVAFRLTPTNAPEPDIAFLRADQLQRVQRGRVDGPPDLAVRDRLARQRRTRLRYQAEAVRAGRRRRVLDHRRTRTGRHALPPRPQGEVPRGPPPAGRVGQ